MTGTQDDDAELNFGTWHYMGATWKKDVDMVMTFVFLFDPDAS